MAAPLLYKPSPHWQSCVAFAAAVLVHIGAVALAERAKQDPPMIHVAEEGFVDIIADPDEPPPQETVETPPPDVPPPIDPQESVVPEENPTPAPNPKKTDRAAQPFVRVPTASRAATIGSAKVFALSAPRPEYPYEARRQRAVGSGIALLTIDARTGYVTAVQMTRSTGNPVLDNATISAFRRWRFKPGAVSSVQAPITFTLTGAAF